MNPSTHIEESRIAHRVGGRRFYFTPRNSDARLLTLFSNILPPFLGVYIFAGLVEVTPRPLAASFVLSVPVQLARGISSVVLARAPRWQRGRNNSPEALRDRDGYTRTTDPSERVSRTELCPSPVEQRTRTFLHYSRETYSHIQPHAREKGVSTSSFSLHSPSAWYIEPALGHTFAHIHKHVRT